MGNITAGSYYSNCIFLNYGDSISMKSPSGYAIIIDMCCYGKYLMFIFNHSITLQISAFIKLSAFALLFMSLKEYIIIISLGQIFFIVYCKQITHARAHTRTRAHACAHTCTHMYTYHRRRLTTVQAIAIRWRPTNRDGPLRLRQCRSLAIQINTKTGNPIYRRFWKFFAYKKLVGRIETRTRDRMYCQTIRIVRDISRDDRAIIATCSLRTLTDRLK